MLNLARTDMIQLGLARTRRLLQQTPCPWRAIHVAGTNGKGSVCAYVSAMINANHIKVGRFASPHLINRWDCISINEKTVEEQVFHEVESSVRARNKLLDIKASEFELLTATAFEIFSREKVQVGVVEVGMGGRLDATNIFSNPLVTVITKIGMDHQLYLGDTMLKIASEKAGIMKKGVPCVVDATNPSEILDVFKEHAQRLGAGPVFPVSAGLDKSRNEIWNIISKEAFESHQQTNISLAFEAVKIALGNPLDPLSVTQPLLHAIPKTVLPGRQQSLSIEAITGRKRTVLLDGAHNVQSAEVLSEYVERHLRPSRRPVTWLMAFSKGKNVQEILSTILRTGDNLLAITFGTVDGMPWVQSEGLDQIFSAAQTVCTLNRNEKVIDLQSGLRRATEISNEGPLVIAGSLYLVSDVLRLLSEQ